MFIEIVFGLLIATILMYLWIVYLSWANEYNQPYYNYKFMPISVSPEEKFLLDRWGWALPSEVISDTYKYLYFWSLYYYNLFLIKFE